MIARLHRGNTLSHALDDASRLVSKYAWKESLWIIPVQGVNVRVTKGIRHHLEDFACFGRIDGDGFQSEWFLWRPCHHGLASDGLAFRLAC